MLIDHELLTFELALLIIVEFCTKRKKILEKNRHTLLAHVPIYKLKCLEANLC